MKFEIKNRWNGSVIFSVETESLKLCVLAAVKARVSLSGANLSGANLSEAKLRGAKLSGANLIGANLSEAKLREANLIGADLSGAKLSGAKLREADLSEANLSGADLSEANLIGADLSEANLIGANLSEADLSGAKLRGAKLRGANLSGADLSGADLSEADLSEAPFRVAHLDAKILRAMEKGGTLEMSQWHTCGTKHCRGGWAVFLAGEAGRTLEFMQGTQAAANWIYAASRPGMKLPDFSGTQNNDVVMGDIRACAAKDPIPEGEILEKVRLP